MSFLNEKGFWRNKKGDFIHPDMVAVDKQLEDEVVEEIIAKALKAQEQLAKFKQESVDACYEFVSLLRQKYNMERITSKSGAVTLKNFDGTKEISIQIQKLISFDQKLVLAKEKIDEYLDEKTEYADAEIRTLITRAFDVKQGKIDTKQIISLKAYPIEHPKWLEAMKIIDDSVEIVGTKSYIRFKHKEGVNIENKLTNINLDIANIATFKGDKQ